MNTNQPTYVFIILLGWFTSFSCFAFSDWQCFAFNQQHQSFVGNALTQQAAMKLAKNNCNNDAKSSTICTSAQSYCQQRTRVITSKLKCHVSDRKGKVFVGHSCNQAMRTCQQWQFKAGAPNRSGCIQI